MKKTSNQEVVNLKYKLEGIPEIHKELDSIIKKIQTINKLKIKIKVDIQK